MINLHFRFAIQKKHAILFLDLVGLKHTGKLLPPNWHERNATGTVNQIEGEVTPPLPCA